MTYVDINNNVKQVFWNGMNNTFSEAMKSKNMIEKDFGETGLFSNKTGKYGVASDFFEWKPNYLTIKDVLNAEQLTKLKEGTTVITHSAGNEDIYKAIKTNNLVNSKVPIYLISVGSPRSKTDLEKVGKKAGIKSIVQINHPNDPVANGFLNKDADYEVDLKQKVLIYDDLIENHPFDNYYNKEDVKEKIEKVKNE